MKNWPPIRTRPVLGGWDILEIWGKATAGMVSISLVLGALAFGLSWLISAMGLYAYPINSRIEALGLLFVLAPVVAVPTLVLAVPVVALALWRGFAGWGVSMLVATLAGITALWFLEGFLLTRDVLTYGAPLGFLFGVLFWLSAKIFSPRVFRTPEGGRTTADGKS